MTRPRQVKVGPFTYQIVWVKEKDWEHNPNWGGVNDHDACVIYMRLMPNRHEDVLKETLLHEMMHAVWAVSGVSHFLKPPEDDDTEEYTINSTSPTLFAALRDNPQVVRWLLA